MLRSTNNSNSTAVNSQVESLIPDCCDIRELWQMKMIESFFSNVLSNIVFYYFSNLVQLLYVSFLPVLIYFVWLFWIYCLLAAG